MPRITLVQVGIGTVGGAVIEQVLANRDHWRQTLGVDVGIGAIVARRGAVVETAPSGLSDELLRLAVGTRRSGGGLADVATTRSASMVPAAEAIAALAADRVTIVLDAGAGDETAALDAQILALGGGVVLSNKAPLALPMANPVGAALWEAAGPSGHLRYEATCGAGLPVISSLRTLLDSGDEVVEIQGALSGTLGAICSDVAAGAAFSDAIRGAKERGYTEPDPRDDLSGLDVARKALILARTIGRRVDLETVQIESLVPEAMRTGSIDEFLDQIGAMDNQITQRAGEARQAQQALKYVAVVGRDGPLTVGMRAIPTSGVLGALQGPENIVTIRTRRYDAYPLNIAGPGAGAEVTAAGMLADALALARGPLTRGVERMSS